MPVLHQRLAELSKLWGAKAGLKNVSLDSFIISATPYHKLRDHYGDGMWTRDTFASKHILFPEPAVNGAYLRPLFGYASD